MSTQSDVGRQSKIVVIGGFVAVCAVGYVIATWFANSNARQSQISPVQTQGRGTPTSESEQYAQVLDKYNRKNAGDAEEKGQSYLSVLSSRPKDVPEQPASATQIQAQFPQQPAGNEQPAQQQNPQQDQQRQKDVADQMQGLMTNWAPVPHGTARVSNDSADYAKSLTRTPDLQQQPGAVAAALKTKIVDDFALVPAILDTDIDTDENSVVRAIIPTGQYAGGMVFAMGYKRLTDTVDMTFTFMKWQGHSYKITAKAMDQTSMRTSLSGEVNNRYFSRIILPAIAMGIGRAGSLYEQAAAQNIITPQGGVIQTYPSTPSASAIGGTIAGGMGAQAGQVLANDAANLPVKQVLITRGTTIGIQFIGPVLASDDVALGTSGGAQQSQQGADPLAALGQPASQPPRQNYAAPPTGAYGGTPYGATGVMPAPGYYQPPAYSSYPRY